MNAGSPLSKFYSNGNIDVVNVGFFCLHVLACMCEWLHINGLCLPCTFSNQCPWIEWQEILKVTTKYNFNFGIIATLKVFYSWGNPLLLVINAEIGVWFLVNLVQGYNVHSSSSYPSKSIVLYRQINHSTESHL